MGGKRRDDNRQLRPEEVEALDEEEGEGPGSFQRASDEKLRGRRIVSASKKWKDKAAAAAAAASGGGGSSNSPFAGFQGLAAAAAAAPQPPKPFAGFTGFTGLTQPPSKAPPAAAPAAAAAAAAAPAKPAQPATSSSITGTLSTSMKKLNSNFSAWVQQQLTENPISAWTDGVADYIDYVQKLQEKYKGVEEEAQAPSAAPSPKPAAVFSGFGAAAAAAAAAVAAAPPPKPAAAFSGFGGGFTAPNINSSSIPAAAAPAPAAAAGGDEDAMPLEAPASLGRAEGEEDEIVEYEVRAKLYRFNVEEKSYGDMGKGVLRTMKHKQTGSRRLVLRNDGGKVLLNLRVYEGMKLDVKTDAIGFVAKEEGGPVTYLLRVKPSNLAPLKAAMERRD
jgi:nucleoporin NUP2